MGHAIPERAGLSLLEVMIATGILAGSAIVLSSIIGTGSRFGNRAESRVTAMIHANSLLDECLARIATGNSPQEISGEIPGPTPWSFEIMIRDLSEQNPTRGAKTRDSQSIRETGSKDSEQSGGLVQVEVLLFDSNSKGDKQSSKPIVHLSQITRRGPVP